MSPLTASLTHCPGSVWGMHDDGDRLGRCHFCGRKINTVVPAPPPNHRVKAELDLAYSYYWDPDFGTDYADVY